MHEILFLISLNDNEYINVWNSIFHSLISFIVNANVCTDFSIILQIIIY